MKMKTEFNEINFLRIQKIENQQLQNTRIQWKEKENAMKV